MSQCPFLTTSVESVQCFKECVLNNWDENGGVCPFKNLSTFKPFKVKGLYDFDFIDEDDDDEFLKVSGEEKYY